jgi:hypothetical protein
MVLFAMIVNQLILGLAPPVNMLAQIPAPLQVIVVAFTPFAARQPTVVLAPRLVFAVQTPAKPRLAVVQLIAMTAIVVPPMFAIHQIPAPLLVRTILSLLALIATAVVLAPALVLPTTIAPPLQTLLLQPSILSLP